MKERRELFHVLFHAGKTATELIYFRSKHVHFLLVGGFRMIAFSDFRQKIRTPTLELVMTELPELGFCVRDCITNTNSIRFDFAKSIKILSRQAKKGNTTTPGTQKCQILVSLNEYIICTTMDQILRRMLRTNWRTKDEKLLCLKN